MKLNVAEIEFTPSTDVEEEQIKDLAESFKEIGQSHPIIVRSANGSGKYPLVSGEKRLRAAVLLAWTEIEAEVRNVDETEGKVIRAHENLKRHNLPWWEQVVLVEELHVLRQNQHGIAKTGRPRKDDDRPGWGIRDTAEELGVALGPLSEDLNLARAVRLDPALRNIKDKKTAVRLVRQHAQRVEAELEASAPSELDYNQVYYGDSATILGQLPDGCIDHCITDPPWINFFDPSLTIDERTLPVFKQLFRVLKHNSFMYVFSGMDDVTYYCGYDIRNEKGDIVHVIGQLEKIGFNVAKTPVLWHKENAMSRRGVRGWEYDRDFEFIIVAVKGSPVLTTGRRLSGVKRYPAVPPPKLIHKNEKPLALMEDIITDCSFEGNIIVDPFAGSGVVGEACKKLKRRYILCERDGEAYNKINKRMGAK